MIEQDNSTYEFKDGDYYRHIVNEVGLKLAEWKDYTISVPMIVKNEEQFIERALDSLSGFVNEIVVVDTGSTDKTLDIVKKYTDKIYTFKWNDNFADARNFALSKCTGDWILRVDGDEEFPEEAKIPLWAAIQNDSIDIITYDIQNFMEDPEKKGNASFMISRTARAYKNKIGLKYKGRVHEEIDESVEEINKKRDDKNKLRIIPSGICLRHYGYLKNKDILQTKHDYYGVLSQEEIKDDPNNYKPYFNLATHYFHTKRYKEAEENYKKALSLNPKQWLAWHEYGMILYRNAIAKIEKELLEVKNCFDKCKEQLPKDTNKRYINQITVNSMSVDKLLGVKDVSNPQLKTVNNLKENKDEKK